MPALITAVPIPIAGAAVGGAPCFSTSHSKILVSAPFDPMPLPSPCCRPSSLGGSSFKGLPLKQSQFWGGGVSSLREILLLANSSHSAAATGGPAHLPLGLLQVVNAQKKQVDSGSNGEGSVLKSSKTSWKGTNALAVTEGFCIVVAAASYTTSVFRNKQASLVASSSSEERKFVPKVGDLSTWYVPALWAALVINAVLRTVDRRSSSQSTQKVWEERSIKDFTLDQRVGKLEVDVQGVAAIAQMLSRHLEKLGVRFRVTRRTLRDPIQETVELSQKTSEVVRALAKREKFLEKELKETQLVLVSMQAQQEKQLELLVTAMTKTLQSQQASERRNLKELSRRLGEGAHSSEDIGSSVPPLKEKGVGPSNNRNQQVMKDIKTLWKGLVPNPKTSNSSSSSTQMKGSFKEAAKVEEKVEENAVKKGNGHAGLTHGAKEEQSKKSDYNPDTSFTKEDFWATATPRVSFDNSFSSSQTVRETDAESQHSSESGGSTSLGRLDSFFSNKKRIHVPQDDQILQERDFSDPDLDQLFSQSGEHSSSTNSFS
ncbi:unnamed protein product [Calypogeia fissa]